MQSSAQFWLTSYPTQVRTAPRKKINPWTCLSDHVQSNLRYVAALALVLRANYISVLPKQLTLVWAEIVRCPLRKFGT